jgi:integrase
MLPLDAVDLDKAMIDFPRPKSGIERRCPLWPETVAALKATITARPKPKQDDAEGLVFLTSRGRSWLCRGIANPVSVAARKLMSQCGVNGRKGIGFYTLRHTFRTVADGAKDQVAANLIMGHADPSMAGIYRESIDDERLVAVVDYVRHWLFGK